MQLPFTLDRSAPSSLLTQLTEQLRDAIHAGRIPRGARLPSTRALAEQLGLSRNTVVRVYETLISEGLAESRVASGVFVTREAPEGEPPRRPLAVSEPPATAMPVPAPPRAPSPLAGGQKRPTFDFVPGRPDPELFPLKAWRRLLQGCLSYRGAQGVAERGDVFGLPALRAAIAVQLGISRGVTADPEQIIVLSGAQEGLSLVASALLGPSLTAIVEDPCYEAAALTFEAMGAQLHGVRVDEDGLVTAELPEAPAALAYVTPAHQYPTGHALTPKRKLELVSWARRHGCYLLEDDYDSEFHYDSPASRALAGIAPDCTLHLGTFSTTLGPGLRIGYLVAPPQLVESLHAAKQLRGPSCSWLEQAALAELMNSGSYSLHLARSRAQYREGRDALLGALRRNFGGLVVSGEGAGLHVLWQLPAGVPGAGRLEELARRHRVGVYSLASAAACEREPTALGRRSLLLGFAAVPLKQIEPGISRLSDALDDALDEHHVLLSELMLDAPRPSLGRPGLRRGRRGVGASPQKPTAFRTVNARSQRRATEEDGTVMRSVRGIYRYPIKGLSPQPLPGVTIEAGKPFPFDRVFALVRPGVSIETEEPRWAKKGLFLMLMLEDSLARVRTQLDVETLQLDVFPHVDADTGGRRLPLLSVNLGSAEGRAAAEAFFFRQVDKLKAQPRLVRSRDGHFMDKPDNVISCINLATLRSLEAKWGGAVHPLRFRANFYIEGLRPWEEFDWIGSDIRLGDVLFRVDRRNGRCSATNVNPVSGERDMDIPGALRKSFGHKDLGIYLVAQSSGKVVLGDPVTVPELAPHASEPIAVAAPHYGAGSYICRGCYYILDPARGAPGVPPGTDLETLGADFRCPDCGTDKSNFRRHLADSALSEGALVAGP